ncbi:hypothetical protein F5Y18DRAFT_235372 [Xylariaceae sp. FL1019]|nr:hypothetical protein F5Y18DRAFT_235372 [Xylariaceae sp. FL1019]
MQTLGSTEHRSKRRNRHTIEQNSVAVAVAAVGGVGVVDAERGRNGRNRLKEVALVWSHQMDAACWFLLRRPSPPGALRTWPSRGVACSRFFARGGGDRTATGVAVSIANLHGAWGHSSRTRGRRDAVSGDLCQTLACVQAAVTGCLVVEGAGTLVQQFAYKARLTAPCNLPRYKS